MAEPNDILPPFAALRAFRAAARRGRFRDAAEELGLTESAISHQIRKLEDFLHVSLFERAGSRVSLTEAGSWYFEDIDPALGRIGEATRALMGGQDRTRVSLTLPPSLAIFWLIPKLSAFEVARPEIDLQLVTTTRRIDLKREQVDLAVRHGAGGWPEMDASFLMSETAMPVASPEFVKTFTQPLSPDSVAGMRVIVNDYFPQEWEEWAAAHGLTPPDPSKAVRLESQEQILAAAESGLGLAMGRSPLVDVRLASGTLIAPFGPMRGAGAGYYLCTPKGRPISAAARRVARWLVDAANATEQSETRTD